MALTKRIIGTILAQVSTKFDIPREYITINAGAASLIHGLRNTTEDVDITIYDRDYDIFNRILITPRLVKYYTPTGIQSGALVINEGHADLHWPDEFDTNYQTEKWRGYNLATKRQLFIDRIKLGREKDIAEMLMLKEYYPTLPPYLKDRYIQLVKDK